MVEEKRLIDAHAAIAPPGLRGKPAFAHRCEHGCGRVVSWNKKSCLRCLVEVTRKNLAEQGIELTDYEIRRLLESKGDIS